VTRLLILSWEYPPLIEGGLARHVRKLAEALVDLGRPAQRRLARVSGQNVIDGGAPRQHTGNDGEQTEDHKTGHH
jgi:hypothetical protein